jgi:hypothetical protein
MGLVSRLRRSHLNVLQMLTNFGIEPLTATLGDGC